MGENTLSSRLWEKGTVQPYPTIILSYPVSTTLLWPHGVTSCPAQLPAWAEPPHPPLPHQCPWRCLLFILGGCCQPACMPAADGGDRIKPASVLGGKGSGLRWRSLEILAADAALLTVQLPPAARAGTPSTLTSSLVAAQDFATEVWTETGWTLASCPFCHPSTLPAALPELRGSPDLSLRAWDNTWGEPNPLSHLKSNALYFKTLLFVLIAHL